ncbi:hypothetical protein CR513_48029, partial [Mucuna pruriens]
MAQGASSWPLAPPPHAHERYKWVSEEVLTYCSSVSRSDVALLVAATEGEDDFIYMYETTFKDFGVVLPLDSFVVDVLWMLEGGRSCPLHSPFCPSLSYYTTRVSQNVDWVSLIPLPKGSLFTAYVHALHEASFVLDDKLVPLYWRLPSKFKGFSKGQLSFEDQANLHLLDELLKGMSCWDLVVASFSHQLIQLMKGEFLFDLISSNSALRRFSNLCFSLFILQRCSASRGYDLSALINKSVMLSKTKTAFVVVVSPGVVGSRDATVVPL